MNIQNPTSVSGSDATPSLQDFQTAASQHDAISLELDGEKWKVQGVGVMPGSGRTVAWVGPENEQTDTTSVFVQALGQSFSAGISRAVARELNLTPRPGQPLSSRDVTQAIDMAQTSQQALAGVDFLTRLQFSASKGGTEFKRVCAQENQDPKQLSPAALAHIDSQIDNQFQIAQAKGASPVSFADAERWLKAALQTLP